MTAPVDEVGGGIIGAGKLDGLGGEMTGEAKMQPGGKFSSTNIIDEQR
jgi:hypothetical protein